MSTSKRARQPQVESSAPEAARPRGTGALKLEPKTSIRVFLVDNCITFRDGLELAIAKSNTLQLVGRACNAEEVFESETMISADVVVIDIDLPGQSGFRLSQWIAKRQPQISILLLCYWDWDVYLVGARAASAWGVLLRTAPTLELVQSIKQVAAGPIYTSEQLARIEHWEKTIGEHLRRLSQREWQMLWLVARGYSKHEIAKKLELKEDTVQKHVSSILQNLEVHSRGMLLSLILTHHLDVLTLLDDAHNPLNNS